MNTTAGTFISKDAIIYLVCVVPIFNALSIETKKAWAAIA